MSKAVDITELLKYIKEHKGLPEGVKDLSGLDLEGADLSDADLSLSNLENTDLRKAKLKGTIFFKANLRGALFNNSEISDADFTGADVRGAKFDNARGHAAGFGSANLEGASFFEADLQASTFTKANLRGADFRCADLSACRLREADMTGADFTEAALGYADLSLAIVKGACFDNADLRQARLRALKGYEKASWIGTDIRDINLAGAYLLRRFVMDQNYLKEFKEQSPFHNVLYWLWYITSDCGRSMTRWMGWIGTLITLFAWLYSFVDIDYGRYPTPLSYFYYSVVTITTLGYGDVVPKTAWGQVVAMVEVTFGYLMLGGLLSIFSNKMARRSE